MRPFGPIPSQVSSIHPYVSFFEFGSIKINIPNLRKLDICMKKCRSILFIGIIVAPVKDIIFLEWDSVHIPSQITTFVIFNCENSFVICVHFFSKVDMTHCFNNNSQSTSIVLTINFEILSCILRSIKSCHKLIIKINKSIIMNNTHNSGSSSLKFSFINDKALFKKFKLL